MARKSLAVVVMGTVIFFLSSISSADVPHMITYSGKVTKVHGGPLNGTFQLTFSIYPDTLGSPADWTETHPEVVVKHGLFSVLLGSVNPIPPLVFDGSIKYLGVQVESDPQMRPLTPIVSVAYAYRAGDADVNCGWVDDGAVVRLETDSDQVGIGEMPPDDVKLHVKTGPSDWMFAIYAEGQKGVKGVSTALAGTGMSGEGGHAGVAGYGGYIGILGQGYYGGWFEGNGYFSGNLGIGTTAPQNKLDVGGGVAVGRNYSGTHTAPANGMIIEGKVGIGTTNPSAELEVTCDGGTGIRLDRPSTAYATDIVYSTAGAFDWGIFQPSGGSSLLIGSRSGPVSLTFLQNGNVGVGASPAYLLDVGGQAHASSFPVSSDERLKKNVRPLANVLEKLKQIRGVSFDWNELYESLGRSTGHREIGVIAQEVEAVFPELVTTWSDEEYRAVDYSRLTAVLVEAVKELKAENEALKQRIDALEGKGMSLPLGR